MNWAELLAEREARETLLAAGEKKVEAWWRDRPDAKKGGRPAQQWRQTQQMRIVVHHSTYKDLMRIAGVRGEQTHNVLASACIEGVVRVWRQHTHLRDLYLRLVNDPADADTVVFGRNDTPGSAATTAGDSWKALGEAFLDLYETGVSVGDITNALHELAERT